MVVSTSQGCREDAELTCVLHLEEWLACQEAGIGAMLSLLLSLPLATEVSQTNDMVLGPEELHLGSFQLEGRVGFLIVPFMAAKPDIWASGADINDGVLRTEAAGPILP